MRLTRIYFSKFACDPFLGKVFLAHIRVKGNYEKGFKEFLKNLPLEFRRAYF